MGSTAVRRMVPSKREFGCVRARWVRDVVSQGGGGGWTRSVGFDGVWDLGGGGEL